MDDLGTMLMVVAICIGAVCCHTCEESTKTRRYEACMHSQRGSIETCGKP